MRIVYKDLRNRPLRLRASIGCVIAEEHDLHQRDEDHADGWWPAGVLLFVGPV